MSSFNDGDAQHPGQVAPAEIPETAPSPTRKRPPSPQNCRNFIRKQTANAMPRIVKTFVEKAKKGSVPHFASLAKVGGFDQRNGAAETPRVKRRSLARQLLDEVERYEARQAAEKAAEEEAQIAGQLAHQDDNPGPQEHS